LLEVLVVDLELLRHAGAEVVQHHVGFTHQVVEHGQALFTLQIDAHALLVAVEREEVGAHALERMPRVLGQQSTCAFASQRLDFDCFRPEIGKDHSRIGARQHVGQIEDANPL